MIQLKLTKNENNLYYHCQCFVIYHPHFWHGNPKFFAHSFSSTRIKGSCSYPANHPRPTGSRCIRDRFYRWNPHHGNRDRVDRNIAASLSKKTEIKKGQVRLSFFTTISNPVRSPAAPPRYGSKSPTSHTKTINEISLCAR